MYRIVIVLTEYAVQIATTQARGREGTIEKYSVKEGNKLIPLHHVFLIPAKLRINDNYHKGIIWHIKTHPKT